VTIVSLSLGSPMLFEILSVNKRKVRFLSCQGAGFFFAFSFPFAFPGSSNRATCTSLRWIT
jgi:hypothetical protein